METKTQNNLITNVGISRRPLAALSEIHNSVIDAFIDRYKDFIKNPVPQQIQFAKDMFNLITSDVDTSYITVVSARCGIGKSTVITALINFFCCYWNFNCYAPRNEDSIGAIVITDKLDRLKDFQTEPQHIQSLWGEPNPFEKIKEFATFITSRDIEKSAKDLLIASQYKPIVLLTTQRYFSMSDEQREMLFSYYYSKGKIKIKQKREIVIFDEKPYFSEITPIRIKHFNDVDTALQDGIPENMDNRDDKDWILSEYRAFRDKMQALLREKEKTPENTDRFYWQDKNTSNITSNDERFFELVEKHQSSINAVYDHALIDLKNFKRLISDGAFFTTKKSNNYQSYETYFELLQSNRSKFYLGENKAKFFVLDATADIDPDYLVDYVQMIDCSHYNVPLNLTIKFMNVTTSRTEIVNSSESYKTISILNREIDKLFSNVKNHNGMIVVYQDIIDKFSKWTVKYFGGLKGSNEFCSCKDLIHIGNNRFSDFAYLTKYIMQEPAVLSQFQKMNESESRKQIKNFLKLQHGMFTNGRIASIMFQSIMADFEQNIFRTAIRDFTNQENVTVYVFWNCNMFAPLNNMIEERYSPYGASIEYLGTPESVQKLKTENRIKRSGEKTNPQKILDWYSMQPKGKVFKIKDMLKEIALTNKQYERALNTNQAVKNCFTSKSNRKGWYIIA